MLLFCISMYAQESFTLKGKVVDKSNNQPILGANIQVVKTSKGTSTDFDGNYQIAVKKGDKTIEIRRVAYWDAEKNKVYEFITNNLAISPDKVAAIYKHRWQIETMFKRLKQNFPLKYFLGDNQNAIEIQIWSALIIKLIMLVIQRKVKRNWAYSNMIGVMRFHLLTYINLFKFLENPNKQWWELTSRPPEIQLDLFGDTPCY